jgi:murein tripeptide amidase MpaA
MALLFFALVGFAAGNQHVRYDGDVVLRCSFEFSNLEHQHIYQVLLSQPRDEVDFWSHQDIHLTPKSFPSVSSILAAHKIPCETIIENVQDLVDAEQAQTRQVREQAAKGIHAAAPGDPNPDPFFDTYRTFAEINDYCKNLTIAYPNVFQLVQLNNTYEGRPIIVVKATNGGAFGTKPVLFYEGGIHAREWIGHATMTYILGKLSNASDPDVQFLLDTYEFHVVPIVNGDGYVYTWTTDRNWRKTRKPNPGSPCIGTDPNRNWDDHWCEVGASRLPCSDSYCGSNPFSEVEVLTMANHISATNAKQGVKLFVDWHAYGQLWMAPWGCCKDIPPDGAEQEAVGMTALQAIKDTTGYIYQYGTIYNIIYPASGSSADWGYDVPGVKYSYGIELRDTGTYGFLLPANQIRPQGEEIWAATVAISKQIA